jgi:hypothetical protein
MAWKPLPLPETPTGKPLFFKYVSIPQTGYDFFLTDLNQVWEDRTNSLAKLSARSLELETPIDPRQSRSHTDLLLSRIKETLEEAEDHLRLEYAAGPKRLTVSLSISLEDFKLDSLTWDLRCTRSDDASIRTEIVYPLIQAAHMEREHTRQLFEIIQQKDRVISKLLDRIESSGMTLDAVFPTAVGMDRHQASQHIRGLGEFDETERNRLRVDIERDTTKSPVQMFPELQIGAEIVGKDEMETEKGSVEDQLAGQVSQPGSSFSFSRIHT